MQSNASEVDLATEVSHFDKLPAQSWVVRPCELFEAELKECTRIKGRFHQYFIHGELSDCSGWKEDLKRCQLWRKNADQKAMSELVGSEMARREQRLAAHTANDIWKPRQAPPSNWNDPLPERLEAKRQSSFLKQMQDEDSEQSANEALQQKRTGCVIT